MTKLLENIYAIECFDDCYHELFEEIKNDYEIICDMKEVTEAQAAAIVERERGGFAGDVEGYKEYFKPGDWSMDHEPFKSAIKSLQSLLRSKGLAEGNYLIIKKVEG